MIHPTAVIDPKAELAEDVEVGAYCIIGPEVLIGKNTRIASHVVIEGLTSIGANNTVHSFCSLGCAPQDKKYDGEPTRLEIGDGNTFFQSMTISTGTAQDAGVTRIGDHNWLMAYVHIAHDCQIGNHTIFANAVTLGGHVHVGDHVILGGLSAVHQFCIIGEYAMAGGGSMIPQDVPPYVMVSGNRASPVGVNTEGMRRAGFEKTAIESIRHVYKTLYREGLSFEEAKRSILSRADSAIELQPFVHFFSQSTRGVIR